ncbi:run domain Beclin-1-interacting and cysteine-rich domain-containing protein [Uranotaenia lowii]|uniref:run domain Beclin-1-interacting and cysteine-rich domain-containing protein n=1 Tax=Uranotaenia lowii TaxID=190385 RepID=UPI00247864F7|nr:run domain Beclin-1-interacting and cysteine-rich domain-containing protein [Uranotaenia lowii]
MASECADRAECADILHQLITTINELRGSSNIRFKSEEYGPRAVIADSSAVQLGAVPLERLNQLHQSIQRIFTHKIKLFNDQGIPDIWKVVVGLKFSNPAISLDLNRTELTVPNEEKGLLWIFQCVRQYCLSENINWLITDKEHMRNCYESTAFLCDDRYVDAMMVCFNALERGQLALLSQIDPKLYARDKEDRNTIRTIIKRSESHPNLIMFKNNNKLSTRTAKRRQTVHYTMTPRGKQSPHRQRKTSRSLPNLALNDNVQHMVKKQPSDNDCPDSNIPPPALGKRVPSFNYTDNSMPKPVPCILHCEDIKIYTEAPSSSTHQNKSPNKVVSTPQHTRLDLFSFAALTESPRILFNDFIPQCGEKIIKASDSKTVGSVLNDLPSRPIPGQSLTSFLKTVYFSRTNTELDRENAHFSLSEALIATFEQLKWNEGEKLITNRRDMLRKRHSASNFWSSYPGSPQFYGNAQKTTNEGGPSRSLSPSTASKESTSTAVSSFSDSDCSVGLNIASSSGQLEKAPVTSIFTNRLSPDEDLEAIEASECEDNNVKSYSAEGVALSLLSKFNEKQLPSACDLLWLVSEQDAPQQILPIPCDGQIVNPDDQNSLNTIIRGTREWAPPRPQVIFTYSSPLPDRRAQMIKQNYRCAGCGMKVAPNYSSRFRYCHYLGKYNCSACHKNQMSAIPAKVIERWDFTCHPVSSFAYHLLNDIAPCPLYRLTHLNQKLYEKVRVLQVARAIRMNLKYIRDFIFNCRFAEEAKLLFQNVPDHLTNDLDSWSMVDFISVRNGSFQKEYAELIRCCESHIFECELCIAHGFFCENCDRKEIIFPWQKRILKCSKCGSCYHDSCRQDECVKCKRLSRRSSKA